MKLLIDAEIGMARFNNEYYEGFMLKPRLAGYSYCTIERLKRIEQKSAEEANLR